MRPVRNPSFLLRCISASVLTGFFVLASAGFIKAEDMSTPKVPAVYPVQAQLSLPLDVTRLKDGAPVDALVLEDWKGGNCHLQPGSVLHGHVLQVVRRSKASRVSSFGLAFTRADCSVHVASDFNLTLIALVGPYGSGPNGESGLAEAPPLADLPGLSIGGSNGSSNAAPASMRSVDAASNITNFTQFVRQTRTLPKSMLPGEVVDVPHVELHVATGTDGASIVSSNKDARLESRTTLIFLPAVDMQAHRETLATAPGAGNSGAGNVGSASAQAAPSAMSAVKEAAVTQVQPDETEICTSSCNVAGPIAIGASGPAASLPISALGYAPHEKQRATSFNHDDHHLLCTFDPHRLRGRSEDGTETVRSVRAVIVDPTNFKVSRVMEWRVRGEDSYLWRFGSNMVLVHMEHELRLFDSNLNLVKSIPANGPVPWVATSPSTDHTAVAKVQPGPIQGD